MLPEDDHGCGCTICHCGETDPYEQAKCSQKGCGLPLELEKSSYGNNFEEWFKLNFNKEMSYGDFYLDLDFDALKEMLKDAFEAGFNSSSELFDNFTYDEVYTK